MCPCVWGGGANAATVPWTEAWAPEGGVRACRVTSPSSRRVDWDKGAATVTVTGRSPAALPAALAAADGADGTRPAPDCDRERWRAAGDSASQPMTCVPG
jgi:hypothetical protein